VLVHNVDYLMNFQELFTAATGLNTSLIEDAKSRRHTGQGIQESDMSDQRALTNPGFAVIQALVALLVQNGVSCGLSRLPSFSSDNGGKYMIYQRVCL
jgi:hypothetical protein